MPLRVALWCAPHYHCRDRNSNPRANPLPLDAYLIAKRDGDELRQGRQAQRPTQAARRAHQLITEGEPQLEWPVRVEVKNCFPPQSQATLGATTPVELLTVGPSVLQSPVIERLRRTQATAPKNMNLSQLSLCAIALLVGCAASEVVADSPKPNIIFILSDDIAQGDLGCYGQKVIQTPNLDRMAAEGTRYLQAYTGTSVCAPTRSSLMTGLHMGHCPVRANREIQPEGQLPLPEGTYTVAKLLKEQGYATACIGKWGMGMFDTTGSPLKMGFDHFYGYNCQRHAHSYFPAFLYNDDERFSLEGNTGKGGRRTYAQGLIAEETLRWVRQQKDQSFFLFYSVTLPHGRFEIDDQGIYRDKPWTEQQKNYAAMVTRLDSDVGRLVELLKELKIDQRTLVIFSGDNGSSFAPDSAIGKLFDQTMGGKLRGFKRSMYEGGLRQAAIARWPGSVPAGRVSDSPWAFWDFLPTVADLVDAELPADVQTDGLSLAEFLQGGEVPQRDYFYWELHEGKPLQAVRFGDWKAVRNGPAASLELYDLAHDVGETENIAAKRPEIVTKAEKLMRDARVDDPRWRIAKP